MTVSDDANHPAAECSTAKLPQINNIRSIQIRPPRINDR